MGEKETRNVVEKFREFWNDLTQSERNNLYWLLACLRGDDAQASDAVKELTTARIRGILFGGHDTVDFGLFTHPDAKEAKQDALMQMSASRMGSKVWDVLRNRVKAASPHWRGKMNAALKVLVKVMPENKVKDIAKFLDECGRFLE